MSPHSHDPADHYRAMFRIREFEARCFDASRDGIAFGSIHPCAGQEAVPVGVAAALSENDSIFATYRGHGWALASGVPARALLAEVCHKAAGTNGGRAGTAYLSSPEHRFMGENSIVGAGVPIAAGAALAAQRLASGGVAITSVGDGAMNQGALTEGLVFAALRKLPLVVVCENNGWGEMSPAAEMTAGQALSDRVAGLGIAHRRVEGTRPATVTEAARWAVDLARSGGGPVFLECDAPRLWGHHQRDIEHYRSKTDKEHAQATDPLILERERLVRESLCTNAELDAIDVEIRAEYDRIADEVRTMPEPDGADVADHLVKPQSRSTPQPLRGNASRMTYQRAANAALERELADRPEVLVYGEDIAIPGGVFGVTRSLYKKFGGDRVFDTPISESAILGSAVGAALSGLRPVVEIMWADFIFVALDQLINQAANVRYVSRGRLNAPMVVRTQQGATPGSCAQHSQSIEAILAHIPGLKVGIVATAADAYAMLRTAIADDDPCIVIEARELYQVDGDVYLDEPVQPVGGGETVRVGDGPAIVTWGAMVSRAMQAAEVLAREGIDVSVHNVRWLNPVDDALLEAAVDMSGGRVIVAHEANLSGGFGAEVAARIQSNHFGRLSAPVRRIGAPDTRIPAAPALQNVVIPSAATLIAAARDMALDQADRAKEVSA